MSSSSVQAHSPGPGAVTWVLLSLSRCLNEWMNESMSRGLMWRAEAAAAFCIGRRWVGSSLMKGAPPAGFKNPEPRWAAELYQWLVLGDPASREGSPLVW